MGLKEQIENHPVVWVLATLLVGFGAGIAAYKAILEIAQLEVVPVGQYKSDTGDTDLYSTPPHVNVLLAGESETVSLQCPDRNKDRALGIDLVSEHPLKLDVLKDSIWFITLENENQQTNKVMVQLWCELH